MLPKYADRPGEAHAVLHDGAADGTSFQAVILDFEDPQRDGADLLRSLRSLPEGADIPVIVLTSGQDDEAAPLPKELAVGAYLAKPMRASALLEAVVQAIDLTRGLIDEANEAGSELTSASNYGRLLAILELRNIETIPVHPFTWGKAIFPNIKGTKNRKQAAIELCQQNGITIPHMTKNKLSDGAAEAYCISLWQLTKLSTQ
jgi:CheY-like chemotaxis protein